MVYTPAHFREQDRTRALRLMREDPFATLIATSAEGGDGEPWISHLPMIVRERPDGGLTLVGHLARANESARIPESASVLAVFRGPHTYVTPRWYSERSVPTWNYAVVHATGRLRWVREFKPLVALLREMTDVFEPTPPAAEREADAWRFALPEDLRSDAELTGAIVGFEIDVERLDAKFKLSQNRSEADRAGVLRGLASDRTDEMSGRVLALMRENEEKRQS